MKRKSAHRRSKANPLGALILLVLLVGVGFLGFKAYMQLSSMQTVQFDRLNLITQSDEVVLFSLNSTEKTLSIIKIPNDIYLTELAHGYGQYKVGSVYNVGQIDNRGGETLSLTMKEFLGLPIDGYYVSTNNFSIDAKRFFLTPDFIFKNASNLSFSQRLRFLTTIISLRFDKIKSINLNDYASPLVLADGSITQSLEAAEVDRTLAGVLNENRLQDENYRVEVINTTKTVGLGGRVVRLLTNLGLNVINVESTHDLLNSCEIFTTEEAAKSLTVARIVSVYNCKINNKQAEERAAITVKLGQDYTDLLTK